MGCAPSRVAPGPNFGLPLQQTQSRAGIDEVADTHPVLGDIQLNNPALQIALRNMQKQASSKNANTVEMFLKSAFSQINRQEAMRNVIQNERAKANFIKFLKEEFFLGMPQRFREAMEVLDYEMFHEEKLTVSMRLGLASSKRRRVLHEKKMENICDVERYNEIVNSLAINAFSQYLNSRMYKHWRAYEKGAISSLRARVISVMTMATNPRDSPAGGKQQRGGGIKMSLKLTSRSVETQLQQQQQQQSHSKDYMAEKISEHDGSRKAFNNTKEKLNRTSSWSANQALGLDDGDGPKSSSSPAAGAGADVHGKMQKQRSVVDKRVPYKRQATAQSLPTAATEGAETGAETAGAAGEDGTARVDTEHITSSRSDLAAAADWNKGKLPQQSEDEEECPSPAPALLVRTNSFAEKAFTSASIDEKDTVLLMGSTWVAMLIAGIESVPLSFCLMSADPKHYRSDKTIFPFVYVNAKFETEFGYVRENIIGRSYKYLFEKKNKSAAKSSKVDPRKMRERNEIISNVYEQGNERGGGDEEDEDEEEDDQLQTHQTSQDDASNPLVNNMKAVEEAHKRALDESLLDARGKVIDVFIYRGNARKRKAIICTKPIYDQRNTYRYMMCLAVCVPDTNNRSDSPPGTAAAGASQRKKSSNTRSAAGYSSPTGALETTAQIANRRSNKRNTEREMMRQVDFAVLVDLMDTLPNKFEDMNLH